LARTKRFHRNFQGIWKDVGGLGLAPKRGPPKGFTGELNGVGWGGFEEKGGFLEELGKFFGKAH